MHEKAPAILFEEKGGSFPYQNGVQMRHSAGLNTIPWLDLEGGPTMTLKQYILHQLREMQREMATAIRGLSPEHLQTCLPGKKNHVAWIVQHCCANVDIWLCRPTTGDFAIEHTDRFISWPVSPPEDGEQFPNAEILLDRWTCVTDTGIAVNIRINRPK